MTTHGTSELLPVLLDTDVGTNIDDALALAYLLRQPRCRLVGLTTVHGDTLARARLASAICTAFGRGEVPIHRGAERPLRVEPTRPDVPQKRLLADWPHRERFEPDSAVAFLRACIWAHPGRLTLVCIGPLTNVALLFEQAPETARLLRQLVCMGGVYFTAPAGYGPVEWNMAADPHAAARVLAADVPATRIAGLDVTTRCRLDAQVCRERFHTAGLPILADLADDWSRQRPEIVFPDPLAAAVAFVTGLCRFREGRVAVQKQPGPDAGRTRLDAADPTGPHRVAWDVQSDRFFEHFWRIVEQPPAEPFT